MNPPINLDPFGLAGRLGGGTRNAYTMMQRVSATARNATELVRYGGLQIDREESAPYAVLANGPVFKLRRYFPDDLPEAQLRPLILVPPLMMMADVFDVTPRTSAVRALHDAGVDAWVVDFGRPEKEPGGLERTLTDHVFAVSDVVDHVRKATGQDVVLTGYSQGGMFCYQTAAYRRNEGIDSLITYGSPVDFNAAPLPVPLSVDAMTHLAEVALKSGLLQRISLPSWFNRSWTRMLDPIKNARFQLQFLTQLHDRERLAPGEQQRQFLDKEGWTAWSGPAFADLLEMVLVQNRMMEGGFVFGDRTVTLADIDQPILIVVGENDGEGHPDSARGIRKAAPRAPVYELTLRSGHFGMVAGSGARKWTWPQVADWIRWRCNEGELPAAIVPIDQVESTRVWRPGAVSQRIQSAADLGVGVSRTGLRTASSTVGLVRRVVREGAAQIPLLNRLDALKPDTAISLGLLLDEAARRNPEGNALLFGDRVLRQNQVKHRVDSVVKGLISVGVRQADRVGVLMSSRPSAFTVVVALSRLGATPVMLRPDGDLEIEAHRGEISWLVSDPEHSGRAEPLPGVAWCVLGGGNGEREFPSHVIDMERIDPEKVTVPAWYRANPHRAADIAFVLFTGVGERTRTREITNQRWALSALGTASASALKPADTVYSVTPLHHSSALLMAVGGAVVAGSRLAFASGTDPNTFWEEVRRYGATHVSYTWTSLRTISNSPVHPNERHHPIKLFIGSGLPPSLWRRIEDRFAPARVLEFYASTDGEAILANVADAKPGAVGRSLPGTAEVKVAAYDGRHGRIATDRDGMGRECGTDEIGLLLARHDPLTPARHVLRGVFKAGDSWQSTGDLFIRDADGDLWPVDPADTLIMTTAGPVPPSRVSNVLGAISAVDLVVTYGVPYGDDQAVVAAITLCDGATLGQWDIESALRRIEPTHRPQYVQVVTQIPLTAWSRPLWRPLREAGVPDPDRAESVWRRRADGESYELLAPTTRRAGQDKGNHGAESAMVLLRAEPSTTQ